MGKSARYSSRPVPAVLRGRFKHQACATVTNGAGTAGQTVIPILEDGAVIAIGSALNGANGAGNCTLTFKLNGSTTIGTLTVAASGAIGDVDYDDDIAPVNVVVGDYVEVESDGGSANNVDIVGSILVVTD